MDLKSFREAWKRQPFKPFVLRLADGRSVPVDHPDFVAMTERIVVVVTEDGSVKHVEPLLIVSIDYPPPKSQSGNGAGRKRRRPPEGGQ
jgi:hypothetical protein